MTQAQIDQGLVGATGKCGDTRVAQGTVRIAIGAGYDFGVAKVGLRYERSQLRDLTAGGFGAAGTAQRNVWILPVVVPLGTGQLIGTYARAGDVKLGVGGAAANAGAKLFALGYNYPLSKRTSWA